MVSKILLTPTMEPQVAEKTQLVKSANAQNLQMFAKLSQMNNTVTMKSQVEEPTPSKKLKSDTSNYRSSQKILSKIKKIQSCI